MKEAAFIFFTYLFAKDERELLQFCAVVSVDKHIRGVERVLVLHTNSLSFRLTCWRNLNVKGKKNNRLIKGIIEKRNIKKLMPLRATDTTSGKFAFTMKPLTQVSPKKKK